MGTMNDYENIDSTLKKFMVDELFIDIAEEEIENHMSLRDELGVDSIGFIELISFIKNRFNVDVLDGDQGSNNFKNIESIVELIKNNKIGS